MMQKIIKEYNERIYKNFSHVRGLTRVRHLLEKFIDSYTTQISVENSTAMVYVESARERSIFSGNNYVDGEEDIISDFLGSLEPESVFFDIGSEYGVYSLLAAGKLDSSNIYAFEPDPYNLSKLLDNISLNDLEVNCLAFPLSDSSSISRLDISRENYAPHLSEEKGIWTVLMPLDDLDELPSPDVVKIDVEGAEMRILKGMKNTLSEIDVIYCEIHPENMKSFGDSFGELEEYLQDSDRTVEKIDDRGEQFFIKSESQN